MSLSEKVPGIPVNNMENRWEQKHSIHCPSPKCRGMLLQNSFYHEHKCSDCGKFWIDITQWHEADNPETEDKLE